MQISECKICKNTFNKRSDSKGTYCSNPCRLEGSRLDRIERNKLQKIQNESRYNENPTFCQQCHLVLTYINRINKFCSHSCAASHYNARRGPMSLDQREKLRKIVTKYHKNNPKERKLPKMHELVCMVCSSVFQSKNPRKTCSSECLKANSSRIGRNNSSRRQSRSKDEIELYRLCDDHYENVSHNTIIADGWDADIVLNENHVAILWNGPWHYKEMPLSNHSLLQVQTRDAIKRKLFESLGWTVVIFEDRYFTPAQAFEYLKCMVPPGGTAPPHPPYESGLAS